MSTDKKQDSANSLDLRGLMCPEPVLRTKKLLDQKPEGAVEVLVDSDINVMNLTRLANSLGLSLHSKEKDGGYMVVISKRNESEAGRIPHNHDVSQTASASGQKASSQKSANTSVVFIAKDTFGEGDRDFSVNLLILLANTGVRLMDPDSSVRKVLDEFKEAGIEVLACGLCVEFYGLKEKIKAEQITNMYAICEYLFSADKVISP
jgi:selenium metabolism protein YedF